MAHKCQENNDKNFWILAHLERQLLSNSSMTQILINRHSQQEVRRVVGQELALLRDLVRKGKRLPIAYGELVFFEQPILVLNPARNTNAEVNANGKARHS